MASKWSPTLVDLAGTVVPQGLMQASLASRIALEQRN